MDVAVPAQAGRTGIWLARGVKFLVLGGLLGGFWTHEYLKHYDPLHPGTGGYGTSAPTDVLVRLTDDDVYVLRHEEGRSFHVRVPVTNQGRWPVTIEKIRLGPQRGEIYFTGLLIDEDMSGEVGEYVPFEPLRVEPGDSVQLVLQARYGPCDRPANQARYVDSLPMDYSLFGLTRHTDLEFGSTLILRGYRGRVCADPDRPRLVVD